VHAVTKLKVSVVRCFTQEEIFGGEVPNHLEGRISPCQRHQPGQEFIMESLVCPEGFCNWAYDDIYRDMAHLWMDGDFPFIGKPGTMFSSCTDGKKPVVFRLERIEG
jgi:uncharacterized repeat protein (TIGR04076 family)